MSLIPTAASRRAAIVGGSMAGLFAALLLARRGWQVDIYERNATELAGRGAGIVTHPALVRALMAAGFSPDEAIGVPVRGRRLYGRDGSVLASLSFPQTNTSWDHLFRRLRESVPAGSYHLGKSVERLTSDEEGATIGFADGTETRADLVVGADGFRSTIRRFCLPDVEPLYAGYVAWRGLVEEVDLSPEAVAALFDDFTFCLPEGEQILGYPVSGADNDLRPGHRRCNFVWYRPAPAGAALARLLTDDTGRTHDVSIPPPLISTGVVNEMRDAARRLLAPIFVEAIDKTAMPFFQPIYDLAVPRMAFGRVILIGDSAFVARPHVGAGVTKAAEDALCLAEALGDTTDIAQGLEGFEANRLPVNNRIVQQGRDLGTCMLTEFSSPEERAAAKRHRDPHSVMRETASLEFLAA